nr:hypothetical protein [Tanacetum cinerariifolium]
EYINSPSWNRPTFYNDGEEHSVQYKEYLANTSNFDIRQLIREECCIEVCEKQKQNMEDTMLELIEVCRQKEFYCMHNNIDDLIESALNSKLLSINLESQRLEVKNIEEQPTKRRTHIAKSLQNFRVKKSFTSLNNTSQISPVHAVTPILPTKEPEYSLSMGYEYLSTIPRKESDKVAKSSFKNVLPIPSEYEVTSDDESECDVPVKDEYSSVFITFSNPIFDCNVDFTSSDDESIFDEDVSIEDFKVYSNPLFDTDEIDSHYFNAESDLIESLSNRDTLFNSSLKFDYLKEFSGELMHRSIIDKERIRREHEEYIILMEKLLAINSFEDNNYQREYIDIFTGTDDLLPLGIESDDYDSKRDIHFLEELLVNDSISLLENELFYFDHHDNLAFPRPHSEPPDVKSFFDLEPNSGEVISAVINNIDEFNEDECFDLRGEINVFTNFEDEDYFPFIFVIRIFLPYLIYPEVSPLLLFAESEDTIFDPGISV